MIRTGGVGQTPANIGGVPVLDQVSWAAGAGADSLGKSSPLSDGILTWAIVQRKHKCIVACGDFTPIYCGMGAYEHAITNSAPEGGALTGVATLRSTWWKQATNPNGGGSPVDCKFSGATSVSLQPEEVIIPDLLGISLARDDIVYERTQIVVTSGDKWPLGTKGLLAGDADGVRSGTGAGPGTDWLHTGTVSLGAAPSWTHFCACGSYSTSALTTQPVIALYGTSKAEGYNSNSNGHKHLIVLAAEAAGIPCVRLARGGESALLLNGSGNHEIRDALAAQATDIVVEHMPNDFKNSFDFTDCATRLRTTHQRLSAIGGGRRVWQLTCGPSYNNSTDGWTTTTGQSPNTNDPIRIATNAWIRAGCPEKAGVPVAPGTSGAVPSPYLYDFIEVADLEETARDSGVWKVGITNDGIHESSSGHPTVAAQLDMNVFWTAFGASNPDPPPPPPATTYIGNMVKIGGTPVRL